MRLMINASPKRKVSKATIIALERITWRLEKWQQRRDAVPDLVSHAKSELIRALRVMRD